MKARRRSEVASLPTQSDRVNHQYADKYRPFLPAINYSGKLAVSIVAVSIEKPLRHWQVRATPSLCR